jgi:hypothetical protein
MSAPHLTEDDIINAAFDALPPGARAHLDGCPACLARVRDARVVLREGAAALDLLAPTPPLRPEVAARVLATLQRPTVAPVRPWLPAALCAALAVVLLRRVLTSPGAGASLLAVAAALLVARLATTRHASIGAVLATAASVTLALWGDAPAGALMLSSGAKCVGVELVGGALVGAVTARFALAQRSSAAVAAACAAGALAAQSAVTLTCHGSGGHLHTLLFHAMGVALAAALGPVLAALPPRPASRVA